MRKTISLLFVLFLSIGLSAQDFSVTVTIHPASRAGEVNLYISPLGIVSASTVEMERSGAVFRATLPVSPSGFYQVVSVRDGAQMIFPIYGGNARSGMLEIDFGKTVPQLSADTEEGDALARYFQYVYQNDRLMWTVPFTSSEEVRPFLQGYLDRAETLVDLGVNDVVADYLRMWAYTHVFDLYTSLPLAAHFKLEELPFGIGDLLIEPAKVLDSPMALLFRSTPQIVFSQLENKGNLDQCLTQLHATYHNPELLRKVTSLVVENFLGTFDYEGHFDEGLVLLEAVTEKFGLEESYLQDFRRCRATIKGQAFPEGVVLKDVEGKVIDFSQFRGKYVYIDLWASWCGPCCKEIPVLQELEKNIKNDKVVFVSISGDTNPAPWKRKMAQLGMGGHQLINSDNSLTKALNVRGIPFFVIYDPEGKMYLYDAPRPSQGQGLVELLENLK